MVESFCTLEGSALNLLCRQLLKVQNTDIIVVVWPVLPPVYLQTAAGLSMLCCRQPPANPEKQILWACQLPRFWTQMAGQYGRILDRYPTAPWFVPFPLSDAHPPAPSPSTHYLHAMCVTVRLLWRQRWWQQRCNGNIAAVAAPVATTTVIAVHCHHCCLHCRCRHSRGCHCCCRYHSQCCCHYCVAAAAVACCCRRCYHHRLHHRHCRFSF